MVVFYLFSLLLLVSSPLQFSYLTKIVLHANAQVLNIFQWQSNWCNQSSLSFLYPVMDVFNIRIYDMSGMFIQFANQFFIGPNMYNKTSYMLVIRSLCFIEFSNGDVFFLYSW